MVHLVAHLSGIPSQKSLEHSFAGIVQKVVIYTLNEADVCVGYIDPRSMRRGTDGTLMPNNQVGTNVVWEANSGYKDNENKL